MLLMLLRLLLAPIFVFRFAPKLLLICRILPESMQGGKAKEWSGVEGGRKRVRHVHWMRFEIIHSIMNDIQMGPQLQRHRRTTAGGRAWRRKRERDRDRERDRERERETCRKCTRSAFNEFGDFSSHKFLRDGGLGTARAATRPARSDLRRRVTGC